MILNPFFFLSFSKRITCEDALDSEYFAESPKAIDPSMFPTWPAKSEISAADKERLKKQSSPKPPSGKATVHYKWSFFCTQYGTSDRSSTRNIFSFLLVTELAL